MRRLVAFVLVPALVVSTAAAASLHVHEYVGHDHPEHHHGPASHEHHPSAIADHGHDAAEEGHHRPVVEADFPVLESDFPVLESESCDPGGHRSTVSMGCASVPRVHVDVAELPGPAMLDPAAPIGSAASVTDLRAHGPPSGLHVPSRAPPLTHLA